jgi:asparaginyl-tRNA synthetase
MVAVLGPADEAYPLQKKRHSFEFLREIAHLRPRSNTFGAVFRVRSAAGLRRPPLLPGARFPLRAHADHHRQRLRGGRRDVPGHHPDPPNPPLAEGQVDWRQDFFGEKTGLTVSGQLEGELFAMAFSDIYTFGPTFRAENSNTSRHAAEFWMIEPEMAFADLADDCALAEEFLAISSPTRWRSAAKTWPSSTSTSRPGSSTAGGGGQAEFRTHDLHRGGGILRRSGRSFQFPVEWGCDLQRSTSAT